MRRPLPPRLTWTLLVAPPLGVMVATVRGPLASGIWVAPGVAFWSVLVATLLCLVGAAAVLALGWHRRLAEVSILGAALIVASVLPMVHALTIPGVLYGPNEAVTVAAFLAVPLALAAAVPLVIPSSAASRAIARAWRGWSVGTIAVTACLAALLLSAPDAIAAPEPGGPLALATVAVSLLGTPALSMRHLRLYRIGRRRASLLTSAGLAYLGGSSLVWLVEQPFSTGWWAAHVLDAAGVLAAAGGLGLAYRGKRSLTETLAPLTNRDPLVALELGLAPVVHRFVAALDQKDPVTRDHVVRVGELAMRAGVRAGIGPDRLRSLGLGALLHDVGKLAAPEAILTKPGPLSDEEFARMKAHTVAGAALMRGSALLAPAAELVRWHHERPDGAGYPDGLREPAIPIEAAIISVCDAWDAMTSNRQYRTALDRGEARRILRDGSGAQWSSQAVALVLEELEASPSLTAPVFEDAGRREGGVAAARGEDLVAVCCEALPADLGAALAAPRRD